MIMIINYGMGNIGSLQNMIKKVGGVSQISSSSAEIAKAAKLILPGVGAFDNGIRRLSETGIAEVLHKRVIQDKIPTLCICLGMQLITDSSEEGVLPGLGWIKARTTKFKFAIEAGLRVPHMGWNSIVQKKPSKLLTGLDAESGFYFVHSYYVSCMNTEDILTVTNHGIDFVSSLEHENIYATQFHPEKSHKFGMTLIRNFLEL